MLFRSEPLLERRERLSGEVSLAVPVSWQTVGFLLFGSLAIALIFLSTASYSRIETVAGRIVPEGGISPVVASRGGIITTIPVVEGQAVAVGETLATIQVEEQSAQGLPAAARIEQAAGLQDASLAAQMAATEAAAQAQLRQLNAQSEGLVAEIAELRTQIGLQEELIQSARQDFERAQEVAERGFISQRDLQVREETLAARRQGLAQLRQSLSSRTAALNENQRASSQAQAQATAQNASLAASRAQVAQQAASAAGARSYVLRAPVTGKVTALTARVGQPARADDALMNVVPAGSEMRAELSVPSQAIGFVKAGQTVRLSIDAFPYQRFGTAQGTVLTVATSPVPVTGPNGETIPAYPVTVALQETTITAFGREEPLLPGMTLTARIVTDDRSLLEWLFEPLFAVLRR